MIQARVFRKHYAIIVLTVLSFIVLGFLLSSTLMRIAEGRNPPMGIGGRAGAGPFFARLVQDFDAHDRVKGLERLQTLAADRLPAIHFYILDKDGRDLSKVGGPEVDARELEGINGPYQFAPVASAERSPKGSVKTERFFGLGGPGGPESGVIRFPGEPAQFLYLIREPRKEPPLLPFLITFGSLILSVVVGIGFALFLIFRSIREKAGLADQVLTELQRGNLKARFPILRMDEMGQAMSRFNRMADEIERLVEQLRNVEKSRMDLLQELAHDLRTPVASLKNLIAVMSKKGVAIEPALQTELLSLSSKEVDYFARLVEDLLVLAQVSEPRYAAGRAPTVVTDLLDGEAEAIAAKYGQEPKTVQLTKDIDAARIQVSGDPHLLRRMLRNAIDNAFSFAKTRVTVSARALGSREAEISIRDDGPGLPPQTLGSFGERRISRILDTSGSGRLSVGLGSVIMKTVAQIHGGHMLASNVVDGDGAVIGAEIRFILPLAGVLGAS